MSWLILLWSASIFVIVGIALEEEELIRKASKFLKIEGFFALPAKVKSRGLRKSLKELGFALLVSGLTVELLAQAVVEVQSDAALRIAKERAAALLKENMQLERALAPRNIIQDALVGAVADLPRVPIFIDALDKEEPKQVAIDIYSALVGLGVGKNTAPWSVKAHAAQFLLSLDGFTFEYSKPSNASVESSSERVAVGLCEAIRAQGYLVRVQQFASNSPVPEELWPSYIPKDSAVIVIGQKPNNFWMYKKMEAMLHKDLHPVEPISACTSEEVNDAVERQKALTQDSTESPP